MPKLRGSYAIPAPFAGPTIVEIAVPSGKLLATDDLRRAPFFVVEATQSINYGAGLDAWAHRYAAEAQVAYAYVGNTCPSVTRLPDGSLVVVSPAWDDETDQPAPLEEEVVVASICTDLWATMLVDYEHWLKNDGPSVDVLNGGATADGDYTVIDVAPGVYRWTAFSHSDSFDIDADGRVEYAKLEFLREL